jgi:hypothetical protein
MALNRGPSEGDRLRVQNKFLGCKPVVGVATQSGPRPSVVVFFKEPNPSIARRIQNWSHTNNIPIQILITGQLES